MWSWSNGSRALNTVVCFCVIFNAKPCDSTTLLFILIPVGGLKLAQLLRNLPCCNYCDGCMMYLLWRQKGDDGFKTQFDVGFTFGQVFCEILRYCGVTMLPLNRLISNCLIIYLWTGPKWTSENIFQNCKMKNGFAPVNDISTHWFPNLFGLIDRKILS